MDINAAKELLQLIQGGLSQGKTVEQALSEGIAQEEMRLKEEEKARVSVQIMPHNVVADYGKFPAVVMMPKQKAIELAYLGIVRIILDPQDEIHPENNAAIKEAINEQLLVRREHDRQTTRTGEPQGSRISNIANFLRREELEEQYKQKGEKKEGTSAAAEQADPPQQQESRRAARG